MVSTSFHQMFCSAHDVDIHVIMPFWNPEDTMCDDKFEKDVLELEWFSYAPSVPASSAVDCKSSLQATYVKARAFHES